MSDETATSTETTKPVRDYVINVGSEFYQTKEEFLEEAKEQGVSRRMPTHCLPDGLTILGSRIWLAHGLGHLEKKDEDGQPQHGVIFGWFIPSAVQFIAGPSGESKYADIIGELKGKQPDTEVIYYEPEVVEHRRKCGFRKVGGTYVVAKTKTTPGESISPIVELTPPQTFVGHPFRGMLELKPEQVKDLEDGRGLNLLVEANCMECGGAVMVSPSTLELAATSLRQIAKGREPKFVLRCETCRNHHKQEEVWKTKAKKLAEHLGGVPALEGLDLHDEANRQTLAITISSYLKRKNGDVSKLLAHLGEKCGELVFAGWDERHQCAQSVIAWVRRRNAEAEEAKAE